MRDEGTGGAFQGRGAGAMPDVITEIWAGLRDAGLPEVMLYLPDGTASRCHWNDTAMIGDIRVALLGDQERKIVRVMPVESCTGIGVASPKGTDPMSYRGFVHGKLQPKPEEAEAAPPAAAAPPPPAPPPPPPPAPAAPPPPPRAGSPASPRVAWPPSAPAAARH